VRAAVALAFAFAVGLSASACSGGSATSGTGGPTTRAIELTVYAAASLRNVLERSKAAYEASHPGLSVTLSTDSSAALETQIEQGAPADVFLSADSSSPGKVADNGLANGTPRPFATNLLVVTVPTANPAGITSPLDLIRPGVKIVAAGEAVPISKYAAELVANLARQPGYPADFAARYTANIVSREDNVAGVVAKIKLGEGDAGIVYRTDASAATGVATIGIPAEANVHATYAGVVIKASRQREAAAAFLDWFAGPDGGAILASFGFLPPAG
jgi:molybdate transport system substrate-binding protein